MKLSIKSTKMEMTEAIKDAIHEKIGSLDKFFDNIQEGFVEVGITTSHHKKGDIFFCEVDFRVPGRVIRSREEREDLYKAINDVRKTLTREIKDYKEKSRE